MLVYIQTRDNKSAFIRVHLRFVFAGAPDSKDADRINRMARIKLFMSFKKGGFTCYQNYIHGHTINSMGADVMGVT